MTPEPFFGVGQWYLDFSQTTDQEVIELLQEARDLVRQDGPARAAGPREGNA
jgi:predicted phosphoribosyltransferase